MLRLSLGKIFSRSQKIFRFSGTKYLKQQDQLSQSQIDQILGNQITISQQQSKRKNISKENNINKSSTITLIQQLQQQSSLTKELFYNLLPIKNQIFPIVKDPQEIQIEQTPNQNIFAVLNLPINSSYKEYTKALENFRTQTDLYGDQQQKYQIDSQKLQFKEILDPQSNYIKLSKKRHLINISIPGTIQTQDPRNFMQLRPIQQFRHTPLIPIADSAMKKHKQMLQQYHRKQFVFQVSKQSMVNFLLVSIAGGICCYMIYLVMKKEQQRTVAYARLKHKRMMGQKGDSGFRI